MTTDPHGMAEQTGTAASHLRWQGAALLPPAVRAALTGPGAAFELVTEDCARP